MGKQLRQWSQKDRREIIIKRQETREEKWSKKDIISAFDLLRHWYKKHSDSHIHTHISIKRIQRCKRKRQIETQLQKHKHRHTDTHCDRTKDNLQKETPTYSTTYTYIDRYWTAHRNTDKHIKTHTEIHEHKQTHTYGHTQIK